MAVTRASGKQRRRTAHKQQPIPTDVSIEREGKLHTGTYTVEDGVVTVRSRAGSIATRVGNSSIVRMAQLLLLELAAEHRRETAAMNALVLSRRGEANDRSVRRRSRIVTIRTPPDAEEIARRLDRIQSLANDLAKSHHDMLSQLDFAMRLSIELVAARLALNPPP